MYQKNRRSVVPLFFLVLLGIAAGGAFLLLTSTPPEQETAQESATNEPFSRIASKDSLVSLPTTVPSTPVPGEEATKQAIIQTNSDSTQSETETQISDLGGQASIFIPSAGIYTSIVQVYLNGTSWDVSKLGSNIGHLEGTAWLGNPGNIVLSGHVELSDGRRGIFANLEKVEIGDFVVVEQGGDEYRYVVTSSYTTAPGDLTPLHPSSTDRLTLITCDNYNFFQDSYLDRIIIVAERVS